jgi:3-polyprenyl-4-hydroxybenzoate decarboxylase
MSNVTITLTDTEVLVLAVLMATTPAAPQEVEDIMNDIAGKILDAQDALETVGI